MAAPGRGSSRGMALRAARNLLLVVVCVVSVAPSPAAGAWPSGGFQIARAEIARAGVRGGDKKGAKGTGKVQEGMSTLRGHAVPMHLKAAVSGLAGGMAGASVGLVLHPLDTVKTMCQADHGKTYKGFWDAGLKAVQQKGIMNGLYAGVFPTAAGSFLSSSMYFATYETMKGYWSEIVPEKMSSLTPSLAAVTGNAVSSLVFVPKEVIKQRCQVGQLAKGQSAFNLIGQIVREEGIGAMYNGYFATLLRNAPGAMLKFGIYEQLKGMLIKLRKRPLNPTEHFGAGMMAGVLSSFTTTPLDVVKTRMMTGQVKSTFPLTAMVNIAREEGARVLWSGFMPRLVWSATFFAVGMSAYELALNQVLHLTYGDYDPRQMARGAGRKVRGAGRKTGELLEKLDPRHIPELIQRVYSPDVNPHLLHTR